MTRLTKECEQEIRKENICESSLCSECGSIHDLLNEIDALRKELSQLKVDYDVAISGSPYPTVMVSPENFKQMKKIGFKE